MNNQKPYPEYVDLSLFNFPSGIDPNILLNLEIGIPVELETGLHVVHEEWPPINVRVNTHRILFYYMHNKDSRLVHNTYGPSTLLSNGTIKYSIHGVLHRLDGPALINNMVGFYLKGVHYKSELEYWIAVEKYKKEYTNE